MDKKQIKDFPEYYVSDDGRIFSDKTNKYKSRHPQQELKGFVNKAGYKYVDLVDGKRHKRYGVHQLVAKYYVDGYFEGAVVDHIDANRLNNNKNNLQWVSQKENIRKSYTDSGLNQCRNYNQYVLISPNGEKKFFKRGYEDVKKYIIDNNINTAVYELRSSQQSRGWKLLIYKKEAIIDEQ